MLVANKIDYSNDPKFQIPMTATNDCKKTRTKNCLMVMMSCLDCNISPTRKMNKENSCIIQWALKLRQDPANKFCSGWSWNQPEKHHYPVNKFPDIFWMRLNSFPSPIFCEINFGCFHDPSNFEVCRIEIGCVNISSHFDAICSHTVWKVFQLWQPEPDRDRVP